MGVGVIEVTHLFSLEKLISKLTNSPSYSPSRHCSFTLIQIVLQVCFQDENNSWVDRGFLRANFYLHNHNTGSAFIGIGQKVRWTYPSIVTLDPYDAIQRHWS